MKINAESGFTLLEQIIIIAIIGILGTITASSWHGFIQRQKVISANDTIHRILLNAKSEARTQSIDMQVSFKPTEQGFAVASHPKSITPLDLSNAAWQEFHAVYLDPKLTTFYCHRTTQICRVQFKWYGAVNGRLGKVVVGNKSHSIHRCVIASTLVGAMRQGRIKIIRGRKSCIPVNQ